MYTFSIAFLVVQKSLHMNREDGFVTIFLICCISPMMILNVKSKLILLFLQYKYLKNKVFSTNMAEQQCQTVQQYIAMLFDDLQPASIPSHNACPQLLRQLTQYGKKIIQLSQQSTFKYRNEHFLPRNQVQQEIGVIFKLVVGEEPEGGFEKMCKIIFQKLQWERKSIWAKHSLPESRLIPVSEFKTEDPFKIVLEEQKTSLRPSRSKARGSRINTTVKQVLQIKGFFEEEETSLRDFYQKVTKMLDNHKVPISSLEPETLKYSRCSSQNASDKIADLVKGTTLNHSKNICNLGHLVDLLHDNLSKRLKNQGAANGKLDAYFQEVKRMEEVYSYTLSKLLENLSAVKSLVRQDPSYCLQHVQTIEEIAQKMYGLYPTSELLHNISSSARGGNQTRAYGVQTNPIKTTQKKTTNPETYRLQIKINETLDKFEKTLKLKKTVEIKEVQKLFQFLRELIPTSKTLPAQEANYQEQFKRLIELNDKREKETCENYNKKIKKLQKKNQELQSLLQQQKIEWQKVTDQWQHERKKLFKKIEQEESEYKKLANQKGHLEVNLSDMLKEIDSMREAVRRQGNEETFKRMQLEKERQELADRTETAVSKLTENIQQMRQQKQKINEQRSIYKQKIQLTQKQLQEQRQLTADLKLQLEGIITEHRVLKAQLREMTITYQQKIREVEQMIENIHKLQDSKKKQETTIEQLTLKLSQITEKSMQQGQNIESYLKYIDQLTKDNNFLKTEVEKEKEEGKLTDSDLKSLKEEVDKVNAAYLESESIIQSTRQELITVNEERQKLFRQKIRLGRLVEDLQSQLNSIKTRLQALQLSERDMKDQYYEKCQQASRASKQNDEIKRQLLRLKKELGEQSSDRAKIQRQLRELRQEVQSKRENESSEKGKHRLDMQNMRVQLRRKGQQLQKQRQAYEERLGVMTQRMQDLEQVLGQKQLLSRLMQHQSQ